MGNKTILRTESICKSFGGNRALKGVDLEIQKGEIHCLAGENGCGKSTLIKIISGDYIADSGKITIDGHEYKKLTPSESIHQGIQVIYQDLSLFPNLSVMENISIAVGLQKGKKGVNWSAYRKWAKQAIDRIGFEIDLDERVENLSIAQKQLVAISRAMLFEAKLIIMDEPTSALTQKEVQRLFQIVKQLKGEGVSILFVSHKMDEVFEISDRITIFRNGERIVTMDAAELDSEHFTYYMTGRKLDKREVSSNNSEESAFKVEHLSLRGAYEDISFEVKKGEIYGITGLLGSGRTELAMSLFGILKSDEGRIHILGKPVKIGSVQDAQRCGIGYVPEDRMTEGLFLPQSIQDNMIISVLDKYSKYHLIYDRPKLSKVTEKWEKSLRIKLASRGDPVLALSGGNQQKVVLAKWLATDMNVLILNGPTVGVDIGAKYDIYQILSELAANGLAIVMITDDLEELLSNCNRFMIMRNGKMVGEISSNETTKGSVANMISEEATGDVVCAGDGI